jgi:putative ABC transport system permease protein
MMRWRNGLLVFEVAMSTVLLIGAGLMIRSLVTLNRVELGFRTEGVLAMAVSLPGQRYPTQDARFEFFRQLEDRVRRISGVDGAGFANRIPMRGSWDSGISIDGPAGPGPMVQAGFQAVSPGFFDTLGIALRKGRLLADSDVKTGEPVAVISETFASRLLGGGDPIGRRFRRGPQMPWISVVGVVADIRRDGKRATIDPQAFLPAAQTQIYPARLQDLAVRFSGDEGRTREALRAAVTAIDPNQPVANVRTLEEVVSRDARDQRFQALLLGVFALLALVLATIGVHGVVSYLVAQRTAEIGVRMALGAGARAILRSLLVGTGLRVLAGAAAGLAAAWMLSTYVGSLLFQVTPTDAVTYALASILLVVVAVSAAAIAAGRATRIDPVRALRTE